jgi:hypothetical protein
VTQLITPPLLKNLTYYRSALFSFALYLGAQSVLGTELRTFFEKKSSKKKI